MTEEIKKCPCCNGTKFTIPEDDIAADSLGWTVWCDICGLHTRAHISRQKAIDAWNTRPVEDDLRRRLAEIEQNGCYTHDETGWMCEIAKENIELKRRLAELTEKQEDNWTYCPTCGCYVGHPYEEEGTGEPYEEKEKRMNECADVLLAGGGTRTTKNLQKNIKRKENENG